MSSEGKQGDPVIVVLASPGAESTRTPGRLRVFAPGQRALRTAGVLGLSLLAAASIIPIPIVHLVGIPLILLVGIGVAVRQAGSVARLAPMRAPCPKCGAPNSIGGGIGYRSATGPIERGCESCRRGMTMTFERP